MPQFESDEEDDETMMAVDGSEGQQYVVLEVIQLADGDDQMVSDADADLISSSILPGGSK